MNLSSKTAVSTDKWSWRSALKSCFRDPKKTSHIVKHILLFHSEQRRSGNSRLAQTYLPAGEKEKRGPLWPPQKAVMETMGSAWMKAIWAEGRGELYLITSFLHSPQGEPKAAYIVILFSTVTSQQSCGVAWVRIGWDKMKKLAGSRGPNSPSVRAVQEQPNVFACRRIPWEGVHRRPPAQLSAQHSPDMDLTRTDQAHHPPWPNRSWGQLSIRWKENQEKESVIPVRSPWSTFKAHHNNRQKTFASLQVSIGAEASPRVLCSG